jgi:GIY-YIG catalytic domain
VHESTRTLVDPTRVFSRAEILGRPSPVPAVPGVYAWYFAEIPGRADVSQCVRFDDITLLYVGISPRKPPRTGETTSKMNLRTRIRQHYALNAEGSTLRLTLGCLLAERLKIQLRRVGSGNRLTFSDDQKARAKVLPILPR